MVLTLETFSDCKQKRKSDLIFNIEKLSNKSTACCKEKSSSCCKTKNNDKEDDDCCKNHQSCKCCTLQLFHTTSIPQPTSLGIVNNNYHENIKLHSKNLHGFEFLNFILQPPKI